MSAPTAGSVVRESFAASVERLHANVPLIDDDGDPEGVHRARVAARRLRSDLRVFASLVDRAWAKDLRSELRWLADALGVARDADVLLVHMREVSAAWPAADRDRVAPVLAALTRQDEEANLALREILASDRAPALLHRLHGSATALPLVGPHDRPAAEILPPLLHAQLDHLHEVAARADSAPTDRRLHGVRIAAKHVRYAARSVAPAVRGARALAEAAEDLQGVLGEHQDAVVAEAWLRRFGADDLADRERVAASAAAARWPGAYALVVAAERRIGA